LAAERFVGHEAHKTPSHGFPPAWPEAFAANGYRAQRVRLRSDSTALKGVTTVSTVERFPKVIRRAHWPDYSGAVSPHKSVHRLIDRSDVLAARQYPDLVLHIVANMGNYPMEENLDLHGDRLLQYFN
jgi:hypothetical protein